MNTEWTEEYVGQLLYKVKNQRFFDPKDDKYDERDSQMLFEEILKKPLMQLFAMYSTQAT